MENFYGVILCGGSGTRLWPISRDDYPKQFSDLFGLYPNGETLLQRTFLRLKEVMPLRNIFLVTNERYYHHVLNQILEVEKGFDPVQIITEPAKKNTAPAIALAARYVVEKGGAKASDPILILPSDHYIEDEKEFHRVARKALSSLDGAIGTIGVKPTDPETGYGYIEKGNKVAATSRVKAFHEKPNLRKAEKYVADGFLWNSGIYLLSFNALRRELKLHCPKVNTYLSSFEEMVRNFRKLPDISIDKAISEKSDRMVVTEGDFGWSDIGSMDKLVQILKPNQHNHVLVDAENVHVLSGNPDKLVAFVGVSGLCVVETGDATLICNSGQSQDVKKVVKSLKDSKRKEINHYMVGYRPWGKYEILTVSDGHQVKKITVFPSKQLSLQRHQRRSEHWLVVQGVAEVTRGRMMDGESEVLETYALKEGESIDIPLKAKHRLANSGEAPLVIIETQFGDYLGEDDIERFDDDFGRV